MELAKTNYMNTLYDFYGALLTKKQQQYLAWYYAEDLSLGEIAENCAVSRQAVYDNIKRTEKTLRGYEDQLQLVAHYRQQQTKLAQLDAYVQVHYPNDVQLQKYLEAVIKTEN